MKIVKGKTAERLIERYLREAPEGEVGSKEWWEEVDDMNPDEILSWDEYAAKAVQGVDELVDVAFEEMPEDVNTKGDIEEALDKILARVKTSFKDERYYAAAVKKYGYNEAKKIAAKPERFAILIEGDAGSGKTARCMSWAEEHGLHVLVKMLSSMDETDLGGTPYAETSTDPDTGAETHVLTKLPATELDELNRPGSILFLDEYNRGTANVRNTCLKLINEHCIPDSRLGKGGVRYFPNLLFCIMCINPGNYNIQDPIDPAERSRVKHLKVESDPLVTRKYLWTKYQKDLRRHLTMNDREAAIQDYGRMQIAKTVLGDPQFEFDDASAVETNNFQNKGVLNARSLTLAIEACDGTPKDFLKEFPYYCGDQPEKINMIKAALENWQDADNVMNRLLKKGTSNKQLNKKGFDAKGEPEEVAGAAADDDDDDDGGSFQANTSSRSAKAKSALSRLRGL